MKHFKHLFTALLLLCCVSVKSFANTTLELSISGEETVDSGSPVEYTDDVVEFYSSSLYTKSNVTVVVEQNSDATYKFTLDCAGLSSNVYGIVADSVVVEDIDGVKYFQASKIKRKSSNGSTYSVTGNLSGKMNNEKLYFNIDGKMNSYDIKIVFGHYFSTGVNEYSINVPSAGQFAHLLLNEIEQWTDVESLTLSGSLNSDDLEYLSRMTNLCVLDLSQTDITSIKGCSGLTKLETIILPSTVVSVGEGAFYNCNFLNSISLPNVVSVGNEAFAHCYSLTSIDLPKVETVGSYAFYDCYSLTSIDLPKAETVGASAFSSCGLTSIDLPNVVSIGERAFGDYLGDCSCRKLSKVTMPNVRIIPRECFACCVSLKEFEYPASLESIGDAAFRNTGLTEAILPEGVKTIVEEAFYGCPLTVISIPSTVTSVGSSAFSTSKVTDVYCYSVVPFSTTTFSNMSNATLHVPEFSINSYRLHDDWYSFAKFVPLEGDLDKLNIYQEFAIYDYTGLADKVDVTLSFGEKENSYSDYSSIAKLTVNANTALSLGKYEQYQDMYNYEYYYDENDNYVYSYPYCTTLVTNNAIAADSVCTHLYMRDGRWNFISFPYDVNVSDILVPEDVLWVVRKYSGSDRAAMTGNTWQNMTDGMTLKAGEGYIFHCYCEASDKVCVSFPAASSDHGTLFAHNDVVSVLNEYPAEYAHNRSWNLIGNPYPAYFNTSDMEFTAPITVWNGSGYTAYSLLDDNYVLRPNEAFFVQRPADSGSVVFKKSGRLHNEDNAAASSAPAANRAGESSTSRSVYNFLLKNAEYTDRARLVVNEDASMGYEINCDAGKFFSSDAAVPQLFINDNGVQYAIDERPLGSGVVGLGAYFGKDGEYTLSLVENPDSNVSVILTDLSTGNKTDLAVDSYTFNAAAGTSNDRFTVALVGTTAIEECAADDETAGDVYTLDGKKVSGVDNLPAGVYIVKRGGSYVKRVVTE